MNLFPLGTSFGVHKASKLKPDTYKIKKIQGFCSLEILDKPRRDFWTVWKTRKPLVRLPLKIILLVLAKGRLYAQATGALSDISNLLPWSQHSGMGLEIHIDGKNAGVLGFAPSLVKSLASPQGNQSLNSFPFPFRPQIPLPISCQSCILHSATSSFSPKQIWPRRLGAFFLHLNIEN